MWLLLLGSFQNAAFAAPIPAAQGYPFDFMPGRRRALRGLSPPGGKVSPT
jgi:hypothetical protein